MLLAFSPYISRVSAEFGAIRWAHGDDEPMPKDNAKWATIAIDSFCANSIVIIDGPRRAVETAVHVANTISSLRPFWSSFHWSSNDAYVPTAERTEKNYVFKYMDALRARGYGPQHMNQWISSVCARLINDKHGTFDTQIDQKKSPIFPSKYKNKRRN